jgi:hypothetical protein
MKPTVKAGPVEEATNYLRGLRRVQIGQRVTLVSLPLAFCGAKTPCKSRAGPVL